MNEQNESSLFPKGDKLSNDWFSGGAFLKPLLAKGKNNDFALGSVTFEPGARTHWHGATATTKMIHIAITNYRGEQNVTWLKPVSDEEFTEANKP